MMMTDVESARRQMIEQQVRAWEVLDLKVLEALARVPREEFVPPVFRDVAFADMCVPLGHGQSMLAPKVEGRILQSLEIQADDRALEIGTGSGFFAACLGQLARSVRSVDLFADFVATAADNLRRTGAHNVSVDVMDAMTLASDQAYDVIALTGSLPIYDGRFERALSVGGRLFVVVGQGPAMEAFRITRARHGEWVRESLFEVALDPLLHAPEPSKFVF
jgi:protein-L-isoaspartate(D-aspartate) O-methyltransferase